MQDKGCKWKFCFQDMKAGVDKFCAAQSNTQKLISHVESNTVEIEHLTQNLQNDVATTLSKYGCIIDVSYCMLKDHLNRCKRVVLR